MAYCGSWKIDDLLTFYANTHRFDTGAATDADAVPAYRIYEDETTTPILTGNMALIDSANTAGFYSEQITLSAANGLEKGKSYAIHIAATVNSVAGATHHTFQIEAEVDSNTNSGTVVVATGGIATTAFAAGAIDAAAIAADAIGAAELAAGAVDEILDDTIGDGTLTVRQALRVLVAGMAAKLSGLPGTTITIRNAADSADVIVATVDANGNRTAVTITP